MNNSFDNLTLVHFTKLTHESSWVVDVSADLAINFDVTLHDDLGDLGVGQGVLETVTQEDHERQGFAQLVGSG